MKIAVVADLHFQGKKLEEKREAWDQAVNKMVCNEVDAVIFAGDIFHARNIGGREASLGSVFNAFVGPMTPLKVKAMALVGNHEVATGQQLSALEIFKETNLGMCDSFGFVKDLEDCILAFIPWVQDTGDRAGELSRWLLIIKKAFELKPEKKKIIIGHLTVRGAQLNSGITIRGGEMELTREQLEDTGADLIVLGHIHKRQWIGDKICYVGALTQDSFGDEGNPQGFAIIDTAKTGVEFVDIEAPRYTTIAVGEELPQGYVKIRCSKKPDNYEELLALPNVTVEIVPEREVVQRKVDGVDPGRTPAELLRAYLKEKGREEERIVKLLEEMEVQA